MDVNVEDVCILQSPCCNPLGLYPLLKWFISSMWPVRLYQLILCVSLGFSVDRYSGIVYLESVKKRIMYLNDWWLPFFFGLFSAPTTFQMDKVLPSLPLPDVAITIKRLMGSLSPYLGEDSVHYQELEAGLRKWYKEEASGCQRRLKAKKWLSGNYATLWWESYTFLCHRQSTHMDTTFVAFQDGKYLQTKNPLARAAVLVYLYGNMRPLLKAGRINPEMFKHQAPMSMEQWYRLFSTTRIPSQNQDDLWTYPPSLSKGVKLYCLEFGGDEPYSPAVLTTLSRDEWLNERSDYFTYGINNASLIDVEKAICLVYLATDSTLKPYQAKGNLWVDKSVNFCVLPSADISIHVDWSSMDPSFFAGVLERLRVAETATMYDPATGNAVYLEEADHECDDPQPLNWQCFDEMVAVYDRALRLCRKDRMAFNFSSLSFTAFGRSKVKFNWHLCTDAFIQAALHATHFKLTGKLALCAEYVPCRLFVNGRSETLRSLTTEMKDFVRCFGAMHTDKLIKTAKASECVELLKKACERHEFLLKHAMTGKGVDRHLLALNIAYKFRTFKRCEVLEKVLKMPFDLVTCRMPNSAFEGAWEIMLPTMDQSSAIHIAYACRNDPDGFHFSISGMGNRVESFTHILEQVLLDLQNLPFQKTT
ncbi:unnamed protein product [Hydatigera taeniaeformis]|uniref:Carn_acyltransf domain-containing protein n=1 Tax=Hydatigena taeniaeformis TaxID=6205 RepID=A0A158RDN1_HYDTA|nr:unnamed protein product [Hydatigera taeniaeformis]